MAFSSAALKTLGELLSGFQFQIPDYQRGFSWGKPQLDALWNDLHVAASARAGQHFTGIVLLKVQHESAGARPVVELVDGQQRVISTMALASALVARIAEFVASAPIAPSFTVCFEDNPELQAYFDCWVLADAHQAYRLDGDCSSYAANMEFAGKYFHHRAQQLTDVATARRYLATLLERFSLFVLDVQPEFDIHVAFETLNNRGKKLTHLELLKNRLIYLTNVLPDDAAPAVGRHASRKMTGASLRQDIHTAWKGIYQSLGRSNVTQNHDDEFLRAHAIAYFGEVKDADWLEKVLLSETFTVTNAALDMAFIHAYIRHLEQAAAWWSHIHDTRRMPKSHQLRLDRIARVGYAFFKPLMLAAYMRAMAVNPGVIARPAEHETHLAPVAALLDQAERYIVLVLTLSGRPAHLGRAYVNKMARALMRPDAPIDGYWTAKGMPTMSYPDALDLAAGYVRAYIENREVGETWTDPRFEWEGEFSEAAVAETAAARLRTGTGYYNWAFTRLVLLEYEEARRGSGNKPVALHWSWDEFSFDASVEHIFPQNADKQGYWEDAVPIDGRAKGLKNAVVHSLGNLLLLSTKVNSSVSTLPFRSKTGRSKRDAYAQGSHSETQVAHVFAAHDWTVASIAARGVAMLKFAEERWSFTLTDNQNNYASYLPLLFGEKAEDVRRGDASGGRQIDNRTLNPLVKALMA